MNNENPKVNFALVNESPEEVVTGTVYMSPKDQENFIKVGIDSSTLVTIYDGTTDLLVPITYDELKALRDSSSLIPGMKYRITDYETSVKQDYCISAHHQFDIVVLALSEDTLSEDAKAMHHDFEPEEDDPAPVYTSFEYYGWLWTYTGQHFEYDAGGNIMTLYIYSQSDYPSETWVIVTDSVDFTSYDIANGDVHFATAESVENATAGSFSEMSYEYAVDAIEIVDEGSSNSDKEYFANSNLEAWKIKYCLDNDSSRFGWVNNSINADAFLVLDMYRDSPLSYLVSYERYPQADNTLTGDASIYTTAWTNDGGITLYFTKDASTLIENGEDIAYYPDDLYNCYRYVVAGSFSTITRGYNMPDTSNFVLNYITMDQKSPGSYAGYAYVVRNTDADVSDLLTEGWKAYTLPPVSDIQVARSGEIENYDGWRVFIKKDASSPFGYYVTYITEDYCITISHLHNASGMQGGAVGYNYTYDESKGGSENNVKGGNRSLVDSSYFNNVYAIDFSHYNGNIVTSGSTLEDMKDNPLDFSGFAIDAIPEGNNCTVPGRLWDDTSVTFVYRSITDYAEMKGVIYDMEDEFGNHMPYDFKNLKFRPIGYEAEPGPAFYTFSYLPDGNIIPQLDFVSPSSPNIFEYNVTHVELLNIMDDNIYDATMPMIDKNITMTQVSVQSPQILEH